MNKYFTEKLKPKQFPHGLIVVTDFFTPEEQERMVKTIDSNPFSQLIHRRQQFYGAIYYHTPQCPRSTLQPITTNEVSPDYLDISPLNWVVDKLKQYGLFEEAEFEIDGDPMVDYTSQDTVNVSGPGSNFLIKQPRPGVDTINVRQELAKLRNVSEDNSKTDDDQSKFPSSFEMDPHKTQILVNEYSIRQNIGTHYDDALAFGPVITGVSLGEHSTLTLTMPHCIAESETFIRMNRAELENLHTNPLRYNEDGEEEEDQDKDEDKGRTTVFKRGDPLDGLKVSLSSLKISEIDIEDMFLDEHLDENEHQEENNDEILTIGTAEVQSKNSTHIENAIDTEACNVKGNNGVSIKRGTSYDCSIRDFTRPQWTAGQGPSILGAFCKCTREEQANSNSIVEGDTFVTSPSVEPESTSTVCPSSILNDQFSSLAPTLSHVNQCKYSAKTVHIPIPPGSVYVLAGSARYKYRHGIKKLPRPAKREYPDYRRLSLTIRSLLPGRRQVSKDAEDDRAKNMEVYKYYQRLLSNDNKYGDCGQ